MEALYHQTSQLIQETSDLFIKLEKDPDRCEDYENAIQSKINSINSNCEKLDIYVYKTPINQRPMAKMRVDQLKYDNKHIQLMNHCTRTYNGTHRDMERALRKTLAEAQEVVPEKKKRKTTYKNKKI